MQDRMQSHSFLMDLAYKGVFNALFPLFLHTAKHIRDRENAFRIADDFMGAFEALRPKYLEAVKGNMAQVLGLPPWSAKVERLTKQVIRNHAYAWVDFFYFGQRPMEAALAQFEQVEGLDHTSALIKEGRGAILLTAHAGNFELGGLLLQTLQAKVHVVYKPDRFDAVERLRSRIRNQGGVVGIPVDGVGFSTLPLLKLLREGKLVGMQGDRDFSMNGLPIPFFGKETYFPRGPWELAAMTGAPILCAFFYMDSRRRFHARFEPPIHITGERGERRSAMEAGMMRYAAYLEDLIRKHPDQWYCFYPFWDDPLRQ